MTTRVEAAIYSLLSGNSAVTGIATGGVWLSRLPQNCAMPAMSIHRIATGYTNPHDSVSKSAQGHFQLSCWGLNPTDPKSLALAATTLLLGFKGIVGGQEIEYIDVVNELELPGISETDFHTAVTILVHYKKET